VEAFSITAKQQHVIDGLEGVQTAMSRRSRSIQKRYKLPTSRTAGSLAMQYCGPSEEDVPLLSMAGVEKSAATDVSPDDKLSPVATPKSSSQDDRVVVVDGIKVQVQPKRSWKSYVWDTFDKSPEVRTL
jgi:hypothetical protein